jgi:hypothetical protein
MSGNVEHDPEYAAARRVLLDALGALGAHCKAVVLVGAQAIYLRVGAGDMAVAPFTTDGDLALNPTVLGDEPILAEALRAAGFDLAIKPGTWSRADVQIDLLVPSERWSRRRRDHRSLLRSARDEPPRRVEAPIVMSTFPPSSAELSDARTRRRRRRHRRRRPS